MYIQGFQALWKISVIKKKKKDSARDSSNPQRCLFKALSILHMDSDVSATANRLLLLGHPSLSSTRPETSAMLSLLPGLGSQER